MTKSTPITEMRRPHIVDNEFFVDQAKQLDGRRAELMSEFGLAPTDKAIFYPVKFFAKKQPLRLIVPHDDTGVLAEALARLASDEPLRRKFQARAASTIKAWNVDAYMAGLREALGLS